jgi:hypothetical protein
MPRLISARALVLALALCALCSAPGLARADAGPSVDFSHVRDFIRAKGASSTASGADGSVGLMDALFASDALVAARAGGRARGGAVASAANAAGRRRLLGGANPETGAAGDEPEATNADADADADAMDATDTTETSRNFLANALLLNRLRASLARDDDAAAATDGGGDAAQTGVAAAALAAALRSYAPAATVFGGVLRDIAARREAALTPPPPAAEDSTVAASDAVDSTVTATGTAFDAARRAAAARAMEFLLNATGDGALATVAAMSAPGSSDGNGTSTATAAELAAALDAWTAALDLGSVDVAAAIDAAIDAGVEGMRTSVAADADAAAAYEALFASLLEAAGVFIQEQFNASLSSNAEGGGGGGGGGGDGTNSSALTGQSFNDLLGAAIEMAQRNALEFVNLGVTPDGDGVDDLSPENAVALLDRVTEVLALARGEFTSALEGSNATDPAGIAGIPFDGAAAGADGYLSYAELMRMIGDVTGLPVTEDGSGGVALTATDDTSWLEQNFAVFGDDPLGLFNFSSLDDGGVAAMSGPPSPTETEDESSTEDTAPSKSEKKDLLDSGNLTMEAILLRATIVLAACVGLCGCCVLCKRAASCRRDVDGNSRSRRMTSTNDMRAAAAADAAANGTETGDANANRVTRTETSTKIDLSDATGGGGGGGETLESFPLGRGRGVTADDTGEIRLALGKIETKVDALGKKARDATNGVDNRA